MDRRRTTKPAQLACHTASTRHAPARPAPARPAPARRSKIAIFGLSPPGLLGSERHNIVSISLISHPRVSSLRPERREHDQEKAIRGADPARSQVGSQLPLNGGRGLRRNDLRAEATRVVTRTPELARARSRPAAHHDQDPLGSTLSPSSGCVDELSSSHQRWRLPGAQTPSNTAHRGRPRDGMEEIMQEVRPLTSSARRYHELAEGTKPVSPLVTPGALWRAGQALGLGSVAEGGAQVPCLLMVGVASRR